MRVRMSFFGAALLALAAPVAAQERQPKVVAQSVIPNGMAGITVVGRSQQVVPADTIAFSASVQIPQGVDLVATGTAIVAVLRKDGVSDANWSGGSFAPQSQIQVTGSVPASPPPDIAKLSADATAVAGKATTQYLQVTLQRRACADLVETLRKRAIDDAHTQALKAAADLGVRLGAPLNMTGNPPLSSSCGQAPGPQVQIFGAFASSQLNGNGTVTLTQALTITYAIVR